MAGEYNPRPFGPPPSKEGGFVSPIPVLANWTVMKYKEKAPKLNAEIAFVVGAYIEGAIWLLFIHIKLGKCEPMQTNEQVVVIQGDATKWYSQAVFIINPNPTAEAVPVDFVAEAEKIIFNYVARKRKYAGESTQAYLDYIPPTIISAKAMRPKVEKRFRPSFLWYGLMILACLAMAVVFAIGWPS